MKSSSMIRALELSNTTPQMQEGASLSGIGMLSLSSLKLRGERPVIRTSPPASSPIVPRHLTRPHPRNHKTTTYQSTYLIIRRPKTTVNMDPSTNTVREQRSNSTTSTGSAGTSPRRSSAGAGLFASLQEQKRSMDPAQTARRQSMHDQKPAPGILGKMWSK